LEFYKFKENLLPLFPRVHCFQSSDNHNKHAINTRTLDIAMKLQNYVSVGSRGVNAKGFYMFHYSIALTTLWRSPP